MTADFFSQSYSDARRRFTEAARSIGASISVYGVNTDDDEDLTIDVAIIGPDDAPTIVTSSGVHGVEGFFGSAVQCAVLDRLGRSKPNQPIRHVLIHAVNPFGFSRLRRFNEDNVDLNRNFLSDLSDYTGAPEGYAELDAFLNSKSPPSRFEPVMGKAIWMICRLGMQAIKQSVAGGQYEYPKGVFFGGHGPSKSVQIIRENCDPWIGSSQQIVHLDFHTGLGTFGAYKLLLAEAAESEAVAWYADAFGRDWIEPSDASAGTGYTISGDFGQWMQEHFSERDYRFVCAEFGTYGLIRVLSSIRAENRAHHYGNEDSAINQSAKSELLECFCPRDSSWRDQVVDASLRIVDQAAQAVMGQR